MFVILAVIRVKPGSAPRYEALIRAVIAETAAYPCFVRFQLHRDPADHDRFMFHEVWTDRASYDAMRAQPFFQAYLHARAEFLQPPVERSDWDLIGDYQLSA